MFSVMNKLRQPQILSLSNGSSLHFLSRETKDITTEEFESPEVKQAIITGDLIVLKMR